MIQIEIKRTSKENGKNQCQETSQENGKNQHKKEAQRKATLKSKVKVYKIDIKKRFLF